MVFHYPRLQLGLSELTTVRLRRTVLAEFLSLLLFVYIG